MRFLLKQMILPGFFVLATTFAAITTLANQPFDWATAIHLSEAQSLTQGNPEVKIAIISSGLNFELDDFRETVVTNDLEAVHGENGIDDDQNGYVDDALGYNFFNHSNKIKDDNGAGTATAHLIRLISPQARFIPIKVFSAIGAGSTNSLIQGIDYAVSRGAHIMNIAIAGYADSERLCRHLKKAVDLGIVVIVAAGNDGLGNIRGLEPAGCPVDDMIVVASTDASGNISVFSNFSPTEVDVATAGTSIQTIDMQGNPTIRSGGTYATAIATGIAALAKSHKMSATPAEIRETLIQGSVQTPGLNGKVVANGYLDALKVVQAIK